MRSVILADETMKLELHPEVEITYGALTAKQYRQAEAIKIRYLGDMQTRFPDAKSFVVTGCPEWIDFICQHGIRSIKGLMTQTGDKAEHQYVAIEEGPYGPKITDECWDELYPFLGADVLTIALGVLMRQRVES